MCLAIPGRVEEIIFKDEARLAKVSFGGIVKEVSLEMVPEAQEGSYVLVHVGVALQLVDEAEAQRTFQYLEEIGELDELEEDET